MGRIRNCFKNNRRRYPDNSDESKDKRRKFGKRKATNDDPTVTSKSAIDIWGVEIFLPAISDGEDDLSMNAYKERISKQSKLLPGRRDNIQLNNAMDKTYAERRQDLVVNLTKISEMLTKYPVLREGDQVKIQFH